MRFLLICCREFVPRTQPRNITYLGKNRMNMLLEVIN